MTFRARHLLGVEPLAPAEITTLLDLAESYVALNRRTVKHGDALEGLTQINLFFENSTRTQSSFELAGKRLGADVMNMAVAQSSVKKGETLIDTALTLNAMQPDLLVVRHPHSGAVNLLAEKVNCAVINAGDGRHEHPTQALLDVFTIREELGTVNGLTVTMLGDLKNGRTTHSLVRLLSLYGVRVNFVSPPSLEMPREVIREVLKLGMSVYETANLDEVIGKTDVLYVTRIQRERFASPEEYEAVKGCYVVNNDVLARAKPDMVVLHPLPRVDEVDLEVDFDIKRAAYFRQMRCGLFIRMALLAMVLQSPA